MRTLVVFLLISLGLLSSAWGRSDLRGYYTCGVHGKVVDDMDGVARENVDFESLGITKSQHFGSIFAKAHYALDFNQSTPKIQALYAGSDVDDKNRALIEKDLLIKLDGKGRLPSVFQAKLDRQAWEKRRALGEGSGPMEIPQSQRWLTEAPPIYVLVHGSVAIVSQGNKKYQDVNYSFCFRDNDQDLSPSELSRAYKNLVQDYRRGVQNTFEFSVDTFDIEPEQELENQRLLIEGLQSYFSNSDLVFRTASGKFLMTAAFAGGSTLLLRQVLGKRFFALMILPPEFLDAFLVSGSGKQVLVLPSSDAISIDEVSELLQNQSWQEIEELLENNPSLKSYFYQILTELNRQYMQGQI